jgi:tripartite-type tricarboxylate transporter receptor subunit TctC
LVVNPLIESGQVRALAKLDRRSPAVLGDLPTLATAAGLPDLDDISVWLGLVAPAGTPPTIIDRLQREVTQIMTNPDALEQSQLTGSYPMTMSPNQFTAFMHREADRLGEGARRTQSALRLNAEGPGSRSTSRRRSGYRRRAPGHLGLPPF